MTQELLMFVWDKELAKSNDAIGAAQIKVSALVFNNGVSDWFTISCNNKVAGQVLIETVFESSVVEEAGPEQETIAPLETPAEEVKVDQNNDSIDKIKLLEALVIEAVIEKS